MFSVYCPTHGSEVLLSERRIERLERIDGGHVLHWLCWCGTRGQEEIRRLPARPPRRSPEHSPAPRRRGIGHLVTAGAEWARSRRRHDANGSTVRATTA